MAIRHIAGPPRAGLFAKALAQQTRTIADNLHDLQYSVGLLAAELEGLPRCVDLDAIVQLSQACITTARRLDEESRQLRGIAQEMNDFLR
jgi:hypothetical protein